MARASAPGKVILFGEHAVVFGQPAVALAIELRMDVRAEPADAFSCNDGSLDDPENRFVAGAVRRVWRDGPLRLAVDSALPRASGLGSSAAVTVATVSALHSLRHERPPPATIAQEAFESEFAVQGRGSPIDTSTCTHGAAVLVTPDERPFLQWTITKDLQRWHVHSLSASDLTLVVGYTGIASDTAAMVKTVQQRYATEGTVERAVEEIGRTAEDGAAALARGDLETVGKLMNRNHKLLAYIGVSHPLLDIYVNHAAPLSYGAKMTGAGGGGSMVALTDRPEEVMEALKALGAQTFLVHADRRGAVAEP